MTGQVGRQWLRKAKLSAVPALLDSVHPVSWFLQSAWCAHGGMFSQCLSSVLGVSGEKGKELLLHLFLNPSLKIYHLGSGRVV